MINMNNNIKIYQGNVIFTKAAKEFKIYNKGYIVVKEGKVEGVYENLPEKYSSYNVLDYGDKLIIPGMNDLHCHAPQFRNLGMAMDKELIPWLNDYTFPEESKYKDLEYAKKMYGKFIKEIWRQGTTRIAIYATIHKEASALLIDMLTKSGLGALVGKVNMDRNSPDFLIESLEDSLKATEELLDKYSSSQLVKPIITPRFVPTCSSKLLSGLGDLSEKYDAPVQSHLSENKGEISWVQDLYPNSNYYGEVYNDFKLFGQKPTLMAHCSFSTEEELELMKNNNVMAVHCPSSNLNVGSGMMPIRKFLDKGISVALGSDISGGHTSSIFKTMVYAIEVSKLFWANSDKKIDFLSNSEAFYLATKGGGSFFGNVGSFEKGYEFDALVIDDSDLNHDNYTLEERLERFIYIGDDRNILHRYVCGNLIDESRILII